MPRNRLVLAATLAASLLTLPFAFPAHAGGVQIDVSGPDRAGIYRVETRGCGVLADMRVEAHAEGRVGRSRRSVALEFLPGSERGVLAFRRTWPAEGRWVLRFTLRENGLTATRITRIADDGRVLPGSMLFGGDGRRECEAALAKL